MTIVQVAERVPTSERLNDQIPVNPERAINPLASSRAIRGEKAAKWVFAAIVFLRRQCQGNELRNSAQLAIKRGATKGNKP